MSDNAVIKNCAAFIWSQAEPPRGGYEQSEYGKVIMPPTALHSVDCVLERNNASSTTTTTSRRP